jgi:hypothetical protein
VLGQSFEKNLQKIELQREMWLDARLVSCGEFFGYAMLCVPMSPCEKWDNRVQSGTFDVHAALDQRDKSRGAPSQKMALKTSVFCEKLREITRFAI